VPTSAPLDHIWFWRVRLPERKDEPCRVVARGAKNSVLVEFADGQRVITSRYAVRKKKGVRNQIEKRFLTGSVEDCRLLAKPG
jgi:hypothetical protein